MHHFAAGAGFDGLLLIITSATKVPTKVMPSTSNAAGMATANILGRK